MALDAYDQLIARETGQREDASKLRFLQALVAKGELLSRLGRKGEADDCFRRVLETGEANAPQLLQYLQKANAALGPDAGPSPQPPESGS